MPLNIEMLRHHVIATSVYPDQRLSGNTRLIFTLLLNHNNNDYSTRSIKDLVHITPTLHLVSSYNDSTNMPPNEIYQFSVIAALMTGLASASSSTTLSDLLSHGNLGLGTFEHLDGEMVVLDGKPFQLKHDGSVSSVPSDAHIPFAAVTQFEAQKQTTARITSKDDLLDCVAGLLKDARNHFVSMQVKGRFASITCRTVPPQKYSGELLTEAGKRQVVKEYKDVEGVIVGFRSPQWAENVSVAGLHVHFISKDRSFGGHVLALEAAGALDVAVSCCTNLKVDLPTSEDFGARDLEQDKEGLKKVEG